MPPYERIEYRTTFGYIQWDSNACEVVGCDNPVPPDGDGWQLLAQSVSELRYSKQAIVWTWRRAGR